MREARHEGVACVSRQPGGRAKLSGSWRHVVVWKHEGPRVPPYGDAAEWSFEDLQRPLR